MRTAVVFVMFLFLSLSSCMEFPEEEVGYAPLVLKSASGFSSETGEIFLQRSVASGLIISTANASITVASAKWTIENSVYNGTEISHKFMTSGKVTLTVDAILSTGVAVNKSFTVNVVDDISKVDPVIMKSVSFANGKTNVFFLFSRERLRHATDSTLYYIGNMTDWKSVRVYYKSYVLNEKGEAVKVNDVGKFIGFTLSLSDANHEMALVHSQTIWTDFTGSAYVEKANPGKLKFSTKAGAITPLGDSYVSDLPGKAGDAYFRFSQSVGKVDLYFKLDGDYTANAFYAYQLANGQFSQPVLLFPVDGKPGWGRAELLEAQYVGRVISFRFGPDYKSPTVFSENMKKSGYFSTFSNGVEIQFQKI